MGIIIFVSTQLQIFSTRAEHNSNSESGDWKAELFDFLRTLSNIAEFLEFAYEEERFAQLKVIIIWAAWELFHEPDCSRTHWNIFAAHKADVAKTKEIGTESREKLHTKNKPRLEKAW